MIKRFLILPLIIVSLALASCSKQSKLFETAKEEGVSTAVGWGLDSVFKYLQIDYLYSLIEANRVHSVKHGKGVQLNINKWQGKSVLYASPVNTIGDKRKIYQSNFLIPGTYRFTSNLGNASIDLRISEHTTIDFVDLVKKLKVDVDMQRGRLRLEVLPKDSTITIYGTPEKYHDGIRLPVGEYKIKVAKAGYISSTAMVAISANKLTKKQIALKLQQAQAPQKKPQQKENIERITVVGSNSDSKRSKEMPEYGLLTIQPLQADIRYQIANTKGDLFEITPEIKLPFGKYQVLAFRGSSNDIVAVKEIDIVDDQLQTLMFDLPPPAYVKELDVSVEINARELSRQRFTLDFIPDEGDTVSVRGRMGVKSRELELKLLNGEYRVEMNIRGTTIDLKTITVSEDKSNQFLYELD